MATAYVTSTGTAAYPGTLAVPTSLTNALASAGAGDTVYIAAGNYTGISSVTYAGASGISGSPVRFIGDTAGAVFASVGSVRITAAANITTGTGNQILTFANNNYIEWSNVIFDRITPSSNVLTLTTCTYFTFSNCIFYGAITATNSAAAPWSHTFQRCVFFGAPCFQTTLTSTNTTTTPWAFTNCLFMPINIGSAARAILINSGAGAGGSVTNCTFLGAEFVNFSTTWSTSNPITIKNCLFGSSSAIYNQTTNGIVCSYNRYTFASLTGVSAGTGSTTGGIFGSDLFESLLFGLNNIQPFTSVNGSPNTSFGNATSAPVADMYGVTWSGTSPDAGAGTYRVIGGVSPYLPTERNASTITIAPGSTSQSIELYLGATGLTASTSGLSAYYNRTRTADVQIPLVARTIAQAWTAGGFAEVNASTMPGVYRLDLPDAAVAAGADDVTVVVRGASGTNGAVMTIKLSSGGLTAAQTASAILDAVGSSYVTAGSIGYAIQNSNVASISGSTTAADELEGALLHNGTDYINAQLIAGGNAGAGDVGGSIIQITEDPQEVTNISAWVNDWHTYVLRLVDENGTPYDITNDTLSVTYTNVATGSSYSFGGGSATITKQMNGQGIISILNPAAYPTAAVIRITIGATIGSTVRRFGPLEIEVLAP